MPALSVRPKCPAPLGSEWGRPERSIFSHAEFERGLLESIVQAKRSEFAVEHTPKQIMARRGRPVGSVKTDAKMAVKLRLDSDVLAALRATGRGWLASARYTAWTQDFHHLFCRLSKRLPAAAIPRLVTKKMNPTKT